MNFSKLWEKLFTRNDQADEIALHISGATVRHRNPFENIKVPRNRKDLSQGFIDKWVMPFYRNGFAGIDEPTMRLFAVAAREIDTRVVKKMLGEFNWRERITGAFFSAINDYRELDDIIGKHLVKSEVCFAGTGYCLALATFKTESAKKYLHEYLDYYLSRTDLRFDQGIAFCALNYIDSKMASRLFPKFDLFMGGNGQSVLDKLKQDFETSMEKLERIRHFRDDTSNPDFKW